MEARSPAERKRQQVWAAWRVVPWPLPKRGCDVLRGHSGCSNAKRTVQWWLSSEKRAQINSSSSLRPGSRRIGSRRCAGERSRSSPRCKMRLWQSLCRPSRPTVAGRLVGASACSQASAICCPGSAGGTGRPPHRTRRETSELANNKRCALPPRQNGLRRPRAY